MREGEEEGGKRRGKEMREGKKGGRVGEGKRAGEGERARGWEREGDGTKQDKELKVILLLFLPLELKELTQLIFLSPHL